jgi:hypothetical protein
MYTLRIFEAYFQVFEVNGSITKEREKVDKATRKTAQS